MTLRLLKLLALLLLLAGCAQLPGTAPGTIAAVRPPRTSISSYTLAGRIAIHQEPRHYMVNIAWQHAPESDQIMLTTPLGQGVAELTRDARGTRLVTAAQREYKAADWQALASEMFGLDLPMDRLPHWLLGEIPADARDIRYDSIGRPQQWLAAGWLIVMLDYESAVPGALPAMIELRRDDIEVRLKIDEWSIR